MPEIDCTRYTAAVSGIQVYSTPQQKTRCQTSKGLAVSALRARPISFKKPKPIFGFDEY